MVEGDSKSLYCHVGEESLGFLGKYIACMVRWGFVGEERWTWNWECMVGYLEKQHRGISQ